LTPAIYYPTAIIHDFVNKIKSHQETQQKPVLSFRAGKFLGEKGIYNKPNNSEKVLA
jgi:hypothetical protein